jgi:hypothetical protein
MTEYTIPIVNIDDGSEYDKVVEAESKIDALQTVDFDDNESVARTFVEDLVDDPDALP